MDRMHPEDLRAKIAMKFVELHAKAGMASFCIQNVVRDTDAMLAELKRTANHAPDTKDAATIALDDIANVCGCPNWEYPGQVTRDVIELKARLDNAMTFVVKAEESLAKYKASSANYKAEAERLRSERIYWSNRSDQMERERDEQRCRAEDAEARVKELEDKLEAESRWETGLRNVVFELWGARRSFEISDVCKEVKALKARLSAIDAAREGEPPMPEPSEGLVWGGK